MFLLQTRKRLVREEKSNVTDFEGRMIIIKNVPCLECLCCGETYYTDDFVQKDEELFEIVKQTMYDYVEMDYKDPTRQVYKLVKVPVQAENMEKIAEQPYCYGK